MKYTIEMASGGMIYVPIFMVIRHSKVLGGSTHTDTQTPTCTQTAR
jgi:hypothetical protein